MYNERHLHVMLIKCQEELEKLSCSDIKLYISISLVFALHSMQVEIGQKSVTIHQVKITISLSQQQVLN